MSVRYEKEAQRGSTAEIRARLLQGLSVSYKDYEDIMDLKKWDSAMRMLQVQHPGLPLVVKDRGISSKKEYRIQRDRLYDCNNPLQIYKGKEALKKGLPKFDQFEGWGEKSGLYHNYKTDCLGYLYDNFYIVCTGSDLRRGKYDDMAIKLVEAGAHTAPYALDIYYNDGSHISLPGINDNKRQLYGSWGESTIFVNAHAGQLCWGKSNVCKYDIHDISHIKVIYEGAQALY